MKFSYTASMRCAATILAASAIYFASPLFSETAVAESEFRARDTILDGLTLEPIAFNPPPVAETELTGGAHLFTAADDTLPYVTLSFYFLGGTQAESLHPENTSDAGGPGSLQAALELMETGGAGARSGEEVAELLAGLGAKLEFQSEYEFWSAKLTILKKDFPKGLELLEDTLLRPRLPAERLQIIQHGMLAALDRRNDDPASIAARKMNEVLFAGYRRGYSLQPEDERALSVPAIRGELNRRLRPGGLFVGASGDVAGLNLETRLNRLIEQFPSVNRTVPIERETISETSDPAFLKRIASLRGRILLVDKPAAQSVINIAGFLPARNHPDMYALQTGNYILGGGSFNSRLTREIRVRRGLAYYAYSYNDFDTTIGRFVAGSGTRSFLAHKTLQLMLETIGGMQTNVATTDLSLARDAILNSLAFQFDSPEDAVFQAFRNRMQKMPENYLQNFPPKIRALGAGDLSAVARKYLRPEDLFIVVAGPADLKSKLEEVRPVIVIAPEGRIADITVAARP